MFVVVLQQRLIALHVHQELMTVQVLVMVVPYWIAQVFVMVVPYWIVQVFVKVNPYWIVQVFVEVMMLA